MGRGVVGKLSEVILKQNRKIIRSNIGRKEVKLMGDIINFGRKTEENLRVKRIKVQVSQKEYDRIQALMKSEGYNNMSEYIRDKAIREPYQRLMKNNNNEEVKFL